VRDLVHLGERWYEPREGIFYSPDAALHRDPTAVVGDPALLPAYTYAESSPLNFVDPSGRKTEPVRGKLSKGFVPAKQTVKKTARAVPVAPPNAGGPDTNAVAGSKSSSKNRVVRFLNNKEQGKKVEAFFDKLEAKALVEIEFIKTSKGYKLDSVKAAPTLSSVGQFNVFEKKESADLAGGGKSSKDRATTKKPAKKVRFK
jgi:RHS repeat-associated protein